MAEQKIKIIAENRKARHDFTIYETFEAGIALTGTEVKSLRAGKANMKDSYAQVTRQAEVFVYNLHISPYDHGNIFNHDPLRSRRLCRRVMSGHNIGYLAFKFAIILNLVFG